MLNPSTPLVKEFGSISSSKASDHFPGSKVPKAPPVEVDERISSLAKDLKGDNTYASLCL